MQIQKFFYRNYDLDATSLKYGRLGDAMGHAIPGPAAISAATSTTVTSTATGRTDAIVQSAFSCVNVGDIIIVVTDNLGTQVVRSVATKTSADEITISGAAVTWVGITSWSFLPFVIGTAATNGWHGCSKSSEKHVQVDLTTLSAAGGLDISIEAMGYGGTSPAVVLAKNYAAAESEIIPILEPCAAIRVGVKGNAGFAGSDDISVSLLETPRR